MADNQENESTTTTLDKLLDGPPKWTNDAFGGIMGITGPYVSQIRNGRHCSYKLAKRIASFFDGKISIEELQDGNPTYLTSASSISAQED